MCVCSFISRDKVEHTNSLGNPCGPRGSRVQTWQMADQKSKIERNQFAAVAIPPHSSLSSEMKYVSKKIVVCK